MSNLSIGIALFGAMLVLMAIRVPIAVAMFVPGAVGYALISGWNPLLNHLKGAVFGRFSVYDLSVIPLFMLMGAFAMHGGLSKALFDFANALLGRFRGGMAMAGILACAAFGSISGSSVATTATIAQVALPEMRRAQLLRTAGDRLTGRRRHAGDPAAALGHADDLRDPHGAEHLQAVPGRLCAGHHRSGRLHSRHRHLREAVPRARAEDRRAQRQRIQPQPVERVADHRHLPGGVRRHLRRLLHADRRRLHRHDDDLPDGAWCAVA